MNSVAQKTDVYAIITDRITALLEKGVAPWQKPWNSEQGAPRNLVSKKAYRGVNIWLLGAQGYTSPFWATFNQYKALGGSVRKGEKSTPIVFWKVYDGKKDENGDKDKRFVLRYYNVFCSSQVDGIEVPAIEATTKKHTPIEVCETIAKGYPKGPQVLHNDTKAYYRPGTDSVHMPSPETFINPSAYYSTLFHELGHSSGHASRLARSTLTDLCPFGSTNYSKEELVAEMTATFLCGVAGIENATIDNSAAYLAGWLKALRGDQKMLVQAAGQAQRAADYILNVKAAETTEE